jgi:hypothetical protein
MQILLPANPLTRRVQSSIVEHRVGEGDLVSALGALLGLACLYIFRRLGSLSGIGHASLFGFASYYLTQ